jgi:hypothetical protein
MKARICTRLSALMVLLATLALPAAGCGGSMPLVKQREEATAASDDLRAGRFSEAEAKATAAIDRNGHNATARAVRAIARYVATSRRLYGLVLGDRHSRRELDAARLRVALEDAEQRLAAVEDDLAVAAKEPDLALELCLACWSVDWDQDGVVDRRDERLLEIEEDADGKEIPEGDPRRRPTFRFDVGDVHWARAMVSFQRAALDLVLAYRFEDLEHMKGKSDAGLYVVHLHDASRVRDAKRRILEGLDHADRTREAYLAETDDDREWVPSPRQASHPLPLPVDEALYATWREVITDVRSLVQGGEGIDVAELARLAGAKLKVAPHGFVDVGRLLSDPHDLSLSEQALEHAERDPDAALKSLFGEAYVARMKPSGLPRRLLRMSQEIERGEESLGRKVRYLFWLN